jgi:predicted XRE-type DNA-binding protein
MGNVRSISKTEKVKVFTASDAFELCEILGLTPQDAVEIEFRSKLKDKIRNIVTAKKLTHEQAAKLSRTSRTRMTAIMNGNASGVSSDLLLRILYSLGYKAQVTFAPVKIAA